MKLTSYLILVPRLRVGGAIPLLPPLCLNGVNRKNVALLLLLSLECWSKPWGIKTVWDAPAAGVYWWP